MTSDFDVAVVGGGPAGAVAAHELARSERRVLLVDPGTTRPRLEGLGERVADLLRQKGFEEALAAASARLPRTVSWAGLSDTANGERLVRRHDFDPALRKAAKTAGATVRTARLSRLESATLENGVRLVLSTGEPITAQLMIDARGRQAPSTDRQRGPQTLAIAGRLSAPADRAGTHVEATPQGWIWSASEPDFGQWLQISIDAGDLVGSGQAALLNRMKWFLAQAKFKGRYTHCGFDGTLLARPAGLVLSVPDLELPVLPIGDAAVAIDPLSGHGMFWAVSSALSAVAGALTFLENPDTAGPLVSRFHRDRMVNTFWRQARIGRDFYRQEENLSEFPFWAARANWPDDEPAHPENRVLSLDQRVVVEGGRLKEREVLVTLQEPDGVAFLCGLPVQLLLDPNSRTPLALPVGVLTETFGRHGRSHALPDAIRWLQSRGLMPLTGDHHSKIQTRMRETA